MASFTEIYKKIEISHRKLKTSRSFWFLTGLQSRPGQRNTVGDKLHSQFPFPLVMFHNFWFVVSSRSKHEPRQIFHVARGKTFPSLSLSMSLSIRKHGGCPQGVLAQSAAQARRNATHESEMKTERRRITQSTDDSIFFFFFPLAESFQVAQRTLNRNFTSQNFQRFKAESIAAQFFLPHTRSSQREARNRLTRKSM